MIGECIRFAQYFIWISMQVTRGMSGSITTKDSKIVFLDSYLLVHWLSGCW